jgi:hypothetical protein
MTTLIDTTQAQAAGARAIEKTPLERYVPPA